MLKNCILLLYIWVSAFSQAQSNYYNKTIDIENSINANEDLFILNQDTSILTLLSIIKMVTQFEVLDTAEIPLIFMVESLIIFTSLIICFFHVEHIIRTIRHIPIF
jgi:hypothetical protein